MNFFKNIYSYRHYTITSAKANLKADVAGSYLNWLWWVLEPMGLMVMYAIIFGWLFQYSIENFPVFIFIGNTVWRFFDGVILSSVTLMKENETLISKIYLPKYILLIAEMLIAGFQMLISFGLTAVLIAIFRIPVSWNLLWTVPVVAVLFVMTFALSTLMLNWGVYLDDLGHAMRILMMVWMYFSGIFFDIRTMVPEPSATLLMRFNFPAFLIDALRAVLIRDSKPDLLELSVWTVIGIAVSAIGIYFINKNENDYVKRL